MRTFRKLLLIFFLIAGGTCAFGQGLILEESTTANYWGYMNQMQAVQSSLRTGKANLNLEVSNKFVLTDSLLDRLSKRFNKLIPAEFFTANVFVIESDTKPNKQGQFIKYTYASIMNNDIKTFLELIVTFEVNMEGEGVKYPKVLKIDVNSPKSVKLNTDKITKEYNKRKAEAEKLPPPPRN